MQAPGRKTTRWAIGVIVLIAIAGSSLLLASALRTQREAGNEIRQRFEKVLALRRAQGLIVDAETGQRGFLLTNQQTYLDPYYKARDRLPGELQQLVGKGDTTSDHSIEELSLAKLHELESTVQMAQTGHKDTALEIVNGGSGKRYMDAIRAETGRLISQQQDGIETAIRRSEQYTTRIYWALALLVTSAVVLLWLGVTMILRTQRLEAEAVRLHEVEEAQRRTALVARELNHRVKNLFSIVIAIIHLASRGAASPKDAVSRIRNRVQALARAHEASLGGDPMSGFDLERMLRTLLAPYASEGAGLDLSGPSVHLPVMRVTPLGLIVHELATNAMKYGAWSRDGGEVAVRWSVTDAPQMNGVRPARVLRICWDEKRSEPIEADGAAGFGSQLINAAVAQLNGSVIRERGDHGLSIIIDAPIIPSLAGSDRTAGD